MEKEEIKKLKTASFKVRQHIIRMSGNGGCFIGASLSCVDIIVYLYKKFLNINRKNLNDPNRDYFLLSKGHDVPALYGTFVEIRLMEEARLKNHLKTNDYIYWHPNTNIPGIEFHAGSLGHLLSVSMGIAIDCKIKKQKNKIVVVMGDGELNEGSNWEGVLVAAAKKLGNLIAVVDRNRFQANIQTEDLIPIEPIEKKFQAFGWKTYRVKGHNFENLHNAFSDIKTNDEVPKVVIADTVRGKGLPSIEARADRWFVNFSDEEVNMLLKELEGVEKAKISSAPLYVR
jgi:transketolase